MVYKVSKGGIRSGNTLRGLRSLQAKRYANQACIVGRTSLAKTDVEKLVSSSADDSFISEALASTDVILSLNKKQRWRLPATVSQMIKSGYFDKDNAMVSILERHKLKRRANCVSFVCNRGMYGHVIPKQKRYFSFNMDTLADDQSRRMLKRAKADMLRKAKIPKVKGPTSRAKTLEVFTLSGLPNVHSPLTSSKPEYRLEVYYPCPRSCSLSFNPKYTDVKLEMNEEGKLEMRSNIRAPKNTQKHRHRMTNKDMEKYSEDLIQEDVISMWDEDFSDDVEEEDDSPKEVDGAKEEDKDSDSEEESAEEHSRDSGSDNLLSCLIAQAEKAKKLWNESKHIKRTRKSSKSTEPYEPEKKTHIIYTNEVNPRLAANTNTKQAKAKGQSIDNGVVLSSGKVILSDSDTSPDQLKERFGQSYADAESEPRRFIINITDDVVNTLMTPRSVKNNSGFTSFLVFIHDGFYDSGLSSYKVLFNSMICTETKRITESLPFQKISIEELTNMIISILLVMKQENLLKVEEFKPSSGKSSAPNDYLKERLNVNVEAFYTAEQINKIVIIEKVDSSKELFRLSDQWENVMFCEICYADVTASHYESLPGTRLNKCGHVFCDNCWRAHFRTRMSSGSVKITCPGYECNAEVGPATLLSLVHVNELNLFLQRQFEADIEVSPDVKWCPNPNCGRAIKVTLIDKNQKSPININCACGLSLCFSCLGKAHWPADCDQAEDYVQALHTLKPHKETDDHIDLPSVSAVPVKPTVVEIEGRMCPACNRFMEKFGGCPHMVCRCGHQFCWKCMKPLSKHGICVEDIVAIKTFSRRIRVRHIELEAPEYAAGHGSSDTSGRPKRRVNKATMYQRALQQKLQSGMSIPRNQTKDLVKRIQHAACDDPEFATEIAVACQMEQSSLQATNPISLSPHVTKFINSCVQMKQSLHHVAEFTFVLLQSVPHGLEKQRALQLANDLSGFCSFISSVFETGTSQDPRVAFRRLVDIRLWAGRALDNLLVTANRLRS